MAEGGYDPTDPTTEKTPLIPDTGDDDDNTIPWDNTDLSQILAPDYQPLDDTDSTHNPFEPGAASTPAGEQIPMTTRTRLPQESGPRTAETNLSEGDTLQNLRTNLKIEAWREVKMEFEDADEDQLDVRYKAAPISGKGRGGSVLEVKMKDSHKWYRLYTKSRGDLSASLNASLPDGIKEALRISLDQVISDTNAALDENQQRLSQLQKNAKQADKIQKEVNQLKLDNRGLAQRLDELRAKKDFLKLLDELKQNKEELETKIAEDKRVIEDEATSSSERAAAEERVAANEAELERVNTEIEVRERQRVKEIFKRGLKRSSRSTAGHFKLLSWLSVWFLALLPLLV